MSLAINTNFARISANQVKFSNSQIQSNETPFNIPAYRVQKNNGDISFTGFNAGKLYKKAANASSVTIEGLVERGKNAIEHIAESFTTAKKTLQIEETPFITGGNNGCPGTSGARQLVEFGSSKSGMAAAIDKADIAASVVGDKSEILNTIGNAAEKKSGIFELLELIGHLF